MQKKRSKKNVIAIMGIGLLIVLAYTVPMMVTTFEDNHLQSKTKSFEIEAIKLYSGKVDLIEELAVFPEVLANHIVVQKSQAEIQVQGNQDFEKMKKGVEEFLSIFHDENTPNFQKFTAMSVVMADVNMDKVYYVWECYAVDENEKEYTFWLDDLTGMILAFEIPADSIQMDGETFYKISEKLAKYYGFTVYKIMDDYESFLNLKKWEGGFYFLDEAQGKELFLPFYKMGNKISVNMYPGETSVYDVE